MAKSKSNIPVSNSTPKNIQIVSRRPGIHDHDEESPGVYHLSPIPKSNIKRHKQKLYRTDEHDGLSGQSSDSEDDHSTEGDISRTSSSHRTFEKSHSVSTKLNCSKPSTETSSTNSLANIFCSNKLAIFTILFGICATVLCLSPSGPIFDEAVSNTRLTIKDLQKKYPSQPNEVWDNLRYSVIDSKELDKPVTFLLLFNKSSEKTTLQLVEDMASYSVGVLNHDCSYEAITLNGHILDPALQSNYILDKYMAELREKFVMIIFNVDGLSGLQAQNFHFLCDTYSPTAFKSVYFFTINVDGEDNSSKSESNMVEGILRKSWTDLDDDRFYPLLTRITNIFIKVVPEEDHL